MNKTSRLILAGGLLLITALLFLTWFLTTRDENPELQEQMDFQDDECPDRAKLTFSITGEEVINLYAEISRLEAELQACRDTKGLQPDKPKSQSRPKPEKATRANTSTTTASTTSTTSKGSINTPNIAINSFEGVISGDFGVTFDNESKLFYYVKNIIKGASEKDASLDNIKNRDSNETHLNGEFGVLGIQVGEYLIFPTSTVVTTAMINDGLYKFAIYIGDHSTYKYDMWLPHEFVKLNKSLANSNGITANESGGFQYEASINYKAK